MTDYSELVKWLRAHADHLRNHFGHTITADVVKESADALSQAQNRIAEIEKAAQAVIDQWHTPNWKLTEPTELKIRNLQAALQQEGK